MNANIVCHQSQTGWKISDILISELDLEKPEDSKSAMDIISKNSIINKDLAAKLKNLISFRNLIVHRYAKINNVLCLQRNAKHFLY